MLPRAIENPIELLMQEIEDGKLISTVLSSPWIKKGLVKVSGRPMRIKGILKYQISKFENQKVIHKNLSAKETKELLYTLCKETFRQASFITETGDYHLIADKKKELKVIRRKRVSSNELDLSHNRTKKYLLPPNAPIPFLVELGVMHANGSVVPKKYDKFRQINRFIEILDDVFKSQSTISEKKRLQIVDFGCGKSYLTFALHHYLTVVKKYQVTILGVDLKKEVMDECNALAKKLGCEGMHFEVGNIQDISLNCNLDLMISLHACDTATDAALYKAISCNTKVILAVPCCQHELNGQIKNDALASLTRYGVLKERFAALVTDAVRAELLTISGYDVQVLEFIDMEHTPKNLLIRAIKTPESKKIEPATKRYQAIKKALMIEPTLELILRNSN